MDGVVADGGRGVVMFDAVVEAPDTVYPGIPPEASWVKVIAVVDGGVVVVAATGAAGVVEAMVTAIRSVDCGVGTVDLGISAGLGG